MANKKRYKNKNSFIQENNKNIALNKNNGNSTASKFIEQYSKDLLNSMHQAEKIARISSSQGTYQPILSEEFLQGVNFNPKEASSRELQDWLLRPQSHDRELRALGQYLHNAVGQYQRAVYYYSTLLRFDTMLYPKDVNNKDKVNKVDYLNSYRKACNVLSSINPKNNFPSMAQETVKNGFSVWYLMEDVNGLIKFLQLPTDWCYIVAKGDTWVSAIDLSYFDRMAFIPKLLPEINDAYNVFTQMRRNLMKGQKSTKEDLVPYQYFPLPINKTLTLTFDPNDSTKVPPLASTFSPSLDILSYRSLLKNMTILDNWKILSAKIPQKKTSEDLLVTYKEALEMTDVVQSTLPDNMTIFTTPFEVTQVNTNQVSTLNDIVNLSNNDFYATAGLNGQQFGESSTTKSAKAIDLSQQIDYLYVAKNLYPQFEKFVHTLLQERCKGYGWKVTFDGNEIKKQEDISTALKAVTTANFPVSLLASQMGLMPGELEALSNIENSLNMKEEVLQPLKSQFTQSGDNLPKGEPGRPALSLGEVDNDSTLAVKDSRGQT